MSSAAAGPDPAIHLEALVRRRGERLVLRDLTLDVPVGATLALLGPNGAGKSTLLRVLAGLMRPSRGTCVVLGRRLPGERSAVRGRVGYLAHEPMLYRDLSVRENLEHRARLLRVGGPRAVTARVDALLDACGLRRRAAFPVHALSRGLTQRTAAAATLLADPELLLLDEPLANLDPAGTADLGALLGPRPAGDGRPPRTRVVAGHDPDAALAEADLVLGLRDGAPALLAAPAGITDAEIGALYR
ncbi:ATP-binding cassette domain-containing protein [Patulibacter sp. SYSU D01012]|uniref:ATP-binding cassette domain-containing protein n=1 Tax=Patulibacter sp. SYSU D01012 TaxID=2817381 RepID=UPI001B3180DE|nr:ATP-binding cassette domain-containing protein [Patulibacter sp. SYSU D01012]